MMTEGQASYTLVQLQAQFHSTKGNVQWWKLSTGEWISKQRFGVDLYELRRHPASGPVGKCNC